MFSALISPAFAAPAYTISGVVHDPAGSRIAHALVAVSSAGSTASVEATTDDQGEFHLQLSAPGSSGLKL